MAAQTAPDPVLVVEGAGVWSSGCITALQLQRRVEARTGPLDVPSERVGRRVRVTFTPQVEGYAVRVAVRARDGAFLGERWLEIEGADCRVADEALVLIVSTLFGVSGGADEAPPFEGEPAAPPPQAPDPAGVEVAGEPPPPRAASREARTAHRQAPPFVWRAHVGAGLATGATPHPAAAVALGAWAARPRWGGGAEAVVLPRSRASLGGGAEAQFRAAFLASQLCVAAARGSRTRFDLCGGVQGGVVRASTAGLVDDAARWLPRLDLAFGPRLRVGAAARRSHAFVAVQVVIPLVLNTLLLRAEDTVPRPYHEDRPGLWLNLGLSWGPAS